MADDDLPLIQPPWQPPLPFPQALYNLVNYLDHNYSNVATWAQDGDGFDIHDMDAFLSFWQDWAVEGSWEGLLRQHGFRQAAHRVLHADGLFRQGDLEAVGRICLAAVDVKFAPKDEDGSLQCLQDLKEEQEEEGVANEEGTAFSSLGQKDSRTLLTEPQGLSLPFPPALAAAHASATNQTSPFGSCSPRDYNRTMRWLDSHPDAMPLIPDLTTAPAKPRHLDSNVSEDSNVPHDNHGGS